MAKRFVSETAMWAAVEAVQIHGRYGYVKEHHVERLMRDARLLRSMRHHRSAAYLWSSGVS